MDKKVAPIKPSEVAKRKQETMPDAVLESFNELIAEDFSNGSATVIQKKVVALMIAKGLKRDDIFDKGWLDVEGIYRKAGWKVEYDKPGFNESYEAKFIFSSKGS